MNDTNPQGITIRFMNTGRPHLDVLTTSAGGSSVRRIDPDCLPEPTFLALPILDTLRNEVGTRIREFSPEMAADRLTREQAPGWRAGIRLATEEEIAAYHAEAQQRAAKMQANREQRAAQELERFTRESQYRRETADAMRRLQQEGKI